MSDKQEYDSGLTSGVNASSFTFWRYRQILWALEPPEGSVERNRRIRRLNAIVELIKTDNGETS